MTMPDAEEINMGGDTASMITELQESIEIYERLQLKSEYLYSYRVQVSLLLQINDIPKLQQLLMEFKP